MVILVVVSALLEVVARGRDFLKDKLPNDTKHAVKGA